MSSSENTIMSRVLETLDGIRPYLKRDGGDVEVKEITPENVLIIKLLGACENCSMSHMTMKLGIEKSIKKSVPEITSVQAINPE